MLALKNWLIVFCLIGIPEIFLTPLFCQDVPHSVNNKGVYEFLDELANNQIISINSAVKPYSRLFISQRLLEAEEKKEQLNQRQQRELEFYLMDFGKEIKEGRTTHDARRTEETLQATFNAPYTSSLFSKNKSTVALRMDLFYYRDSVFSLTVNPILGGEIFNNSSGNATYWRNGAEARGYVKNWGFYASLRDNHEKPLLGKTAFLTQREGGHLKGNTDWSDMQGGVTYSWKWGDAGLVKDRALWGNNYNGANIFGGNNPLLYS
jgi:hypothetical protein